MTRLIYLDTETTSLDERNGEVWEIGAIVRDPGEDDIEYLWQIRPNLEDANPTSLRISRYYERIQVESRLPDVVQLDSNGNHLTTMSSAKLAGILAPMVDGATIVGAVPDFDFRFLRKFLADNGQCWTAHYHLIDIENVAIGYIRGILAQGGRKNPEMVSLLTDLVETLPWKYVNLCKAFSLFPDQYEAHTAIGDARLVRDLHDKITTGALTLDQGMALTA
jgi:DNA polymerase III epsilon subunit-like protein